MAAKKKQEEQGYSYEDTIRLSISLNSLTNKGISVPSLVKVFGLKGEVKTQFGDYEALQTQIMSKYGIEAKDGRYDYSQHEDKAQIIADLMALNKQPVTFKELNFLSPKEFAAATEGRSISEIEILWDLLVQKQ